MDTALVTDLPIEAVSAAIHRGGRFLLVKRGRAPSRGLYAFPGGRVEDGETREDAVRREVEEETGLRLGGVSHLRDIEIAPDPVAGFPGFRLSVYASEDPGGTPVAGDDAESLGWFSTEEMAELPITESTLEVALEILEQTGGPA